MEVIAAISENTGAAKSGLQKGEIILELDGTKAKDAENLKYLNLNLVILLRLLIIVITKLKLRILNLQKMKNKKTVEIRSLQF